MTNDVNGVDQGAHGYDIWQGDMWAPDGNGDPGTKEPIFDIHCYGAKVSTGSKHEAEPGYFDFVTAVIDTNCKSQFIAKRITNYLDYLGKVPVSRVLFGAHGSMFDSCAISVILHEILGHQRRNTLPAMFGN